MDSFRNARRNKIIRKLMALPRDKRIDNIRDIRTIGVICRLDKESVWNGLCHFAKTLEDEGKTVHLVAFQEEKRLPFTVTHQPTTILHLSHGLNLWGFPRRSRIAPFVSQRFDLLIDTVADPCQHSLYIALHTHASLKVAISAAEPCDAYDLFILTNNPMDTNTFLNNVIEYLGMIKK